MKGEFKDELHRSNDCGVSVRFWNLRIEDHNGKGIHDNHSVVSRRFDSNRHVQAGDGRVQKERTKKMIDKKILFEEKVEFKTSELPKWKPSKGWMEAAEEWIATCSGIVPPGFDVKLRNSRRRFLK
jgi:hypothetical protein